jgi:hypothetical protein
MKIEREAGGVGATAKGGSGGGVAMARGCLADFPARRLPGSRFS